MKKIVLVISILFLLTGCGKTQNPIVTMEIEDYGTIKMELYPSKAPNTVANFVTLIESGFYDNNTFHRVVPAFVIQGGDPEGDGTGGPGYAIKGEFKENGYNNNTIKHERGTISMARSINMDSGGSQFFIVLDTSENVTASLDNKYAAFGKVTEGMDIIDKMVEDAEIENEGTGKLEENYVITKTTVETFEKDYTVKKVS